MEGRLIFFLLIRDYYSLLAIIILCKRLLDWNEKIKWICKLHMRFSFPFCLLCVWTDTLFGKHLLYLRASSAFIFIFLPIIRLEQMWGLSVLVRRGFALAFLQPDTTNNACKQLYLFHCQALIYVMVCFICMYLMWHMI